MTRHGCSALLLAALLLGLFASSAGANPVRFERQGTGTYVYGDYPGVGVATISIFTPQAAVCDVKVQLRLAIYRGRRPVGRPVSGGRLTPINGCTGESRPRGLGQTISYPVTRRGPWRVVSGFQFEFSMRGRPRGKYLLCARATGRIETSRGIRPSSHRACRSFRW